MPACTHAKSKRTQTHLVSDDTDAGEAIAGNAPHGRGDEVVLHANAIVGRPLVVQRPLVGPDAVKVAVAAKLGSVARVQDRDHIDLAIAVRVEGLEAEAVRVGLGERLADRIVQSAADLCMCV